jgi:hypothetical protein
VVGAVTTLFKRELFIGNLFAGFQNRQYCPLPVFNSLVATPRNLLSNRSKGFYLAGFEKLSASSKTFGA